MLATAGGTEIRCAHFFMHNLQMICSLLLASRVSRLGGPMLAAVGGTDLRHTGRKLQYTFAVAHKYTASLRAHGDDSSAFNSLLANGNYAG